MNAHTHTGDCPVTCLKPMLSAQSYGLLRSECALICGDQDANIGHAVRLYQKGQLATVRYIGPLRLAEIKSCLTGLGLITGAAESASKTPAGGGEPPPLPAGWSGTAWRGNPTRTFTT